MRYQAMQRTSGFAAEVQQNALQNSDPAADALVFHRDPQSGDVTDGSVDYFDFEWGETVEQDESTMEPVVFDCTNRCGDACRGNGGCRCEETGETGCDGSDNGGGEDGSQNGGDNGNGSFEGCSENLPIQDDSNLYEIIQE